MIVAQPDDGSVAAPDNTPPPPLPPSGEPAPKPKKRGRGWLIFGGIVLILLAGGLGSYVGYQSGIQSRVAKQSSLLAMAAAEQFQLGLDDMNNQRYEMARSRFEYVIKLDPNFPGIKQKLTEVLMALLPTAIPTATLTPTPQFTPTPDMRGEEELFKQIPVLMATAKWDSAIQAIEALRTKNLKYKTIEVDGFYYIALRYRGLNKITLGDLEGGMYDLALSERFGPLDRDADSYRMWARYYVIGASFWQVDWEKATYYFGQVAPSLPNLRDYTNIFAIDRYREAASRYAEKLDKDGESCKASKLLDTVFVNNYKNPTFEALATRVFKECNPPTETPQASKTTTLTPTISVTPSRTAPTPAGPSLTPSLTPPGPTATPSPTGAATVTNATGGGTATFTTTVTRAAALTFTLTPTPIPTINP